MGAKVNATHSNVGEHRILVLVSGGLDSTTLLRYYVRTHGAENVFALCTYYGQKHALELEYAYWQCTKLGVTLKKLDLAPIFAFNADSSSLLRGSSLEIKEQSYAEQLAENGPGMVNSYVPFRNGLFLSTAASVAMQLNCDIVAYGAHADDAAGEAYPDCSAAFVSAMDAAIAEGTGGKVRLEAPFAKLTKAEVVQVGVSLGMTAEDFRHTHSCYKGVPGGCGTCATCIDRKKALAASGICE